MTSTFLFTNNAVSTLASSISNTATTASLSPGSGVLFPNPSAGQYFPMTFVDAATGLLNEIVYVTARSTDTITITRGQEGTAAQAWNAGDLANLLITAGVLTSFTQQATSRIRLTTATTFYVSFTGSDVTGTGSIGNPWATCQNAWNQLVANYDLGGNQVTILRQNSTSYTDPTTCFGLLTGQQQAIIFDASGSGNVTVTTSGSVCYLSDGGADITIQNQKLVCSGNNVLYATHGSRLNHQLNNFGATPDSHLIADRNGQLNSIGNYTISGAAGSHVVVSSGANADMSSAVTLSGTPAITTFVSATECGVINASSASFTGSATGVRYSAALNGVINTGGGGASFFPGNSGGSTATGGQYA